MIYKYFLIRAPDPIVCPGKSALIHTKKGVFPCVFEWPPIHIRQDIHDLKVDENHLFVDCECKTFYEVIQLGIQVGNAN